VQGEARGVIIDASRMEIVCRPFDKIFKHNEAHAASLDWSTAVAEEQIDGSLITWIPVDS